MRIAQKSAKPLCVVFIVKFFRAQFYIQVLAMEKFEEYQYDPEILLMYPITSVFFFFSLVSGNLRYSPEEISLFSGNTLNPKEN